MRTEIHNTRLMYNAMMLRTLFTLYTQFLDDMFIISIKNNIM